MLEDPAHWIQRVSTLAWSTLPKGSRCIPLKAIRAPAEGVSHSLVPAKNVCSCKFNVTIPLPSFHHSVVLWGRLQRTARKAPSLFLAGSHTLFKASCRCPPSVWQRYCLQDVLQCSKGCVRILPFGSRQSESSVLNPCSWRETSLQHHTPVSFFCKPKPKVLLIKET